MIKTHNTHTQKQVRTHSLARKESTFIFFFLNIYRISNHCAHTFHSLSITYYNCLCEESVCDSSDFPQGLILQYNYLSTNSPTYKHTQTHSHTPTHTHYIP